MENKAMTMGADKIARELTQCWQPQSAGLCQCPMCNLRPYLLKALTSYAEAMVKEAREEERKFAKNQDEFIKQEARNAALKEAAKVADKRYNQTGDDNLAALGDEIRQLKAPQNSIGGPDGLRGK